MGYITELTQEITEGRRLDRTQDWTELLQGELEELCRGADEIRKRFCGDRVNLCTIIAGKSGRCSENCKFCAQSAHHQTGCEVYDLLPYAAIYERAKADENEGVDRFAIVLSGRGPSEEDFEKLLKIYGRLHESLHIELCASLGFLTDAQFQRLYEVGVRNYHNNLETSRAHFAKICTTHSFEDKIANIRRAQAAGLRVCSGGIIGMGETMEDRIDLALTLAELGIRSIPINVLLPIPGTPLADLPTLAKEEIRRTVAIFRYINPEADIRLAAGRMLLGDNGKDAFMGGASASITGNMLTTTGSTIREDQEMLSLAGRR